MNTSRTRFWVLLAILAMLLTACGGDNNDTNTLGTNPLVTDGGTPQVFALFDPGPQIMPLPNDVVWQADGDPEVELAACRRRFPRDDPA